MNLEIYNQTFHLESTYWWHMILHDLTEYFLKVEADKNKFLKILDTGCGTGKMLEIAQKYGEISGIDYSCGALNHCKARNLQNIFLLNLNDWNPEHESFDIIICNDVLYHKEILDDTEILKKFFKALKPEGILILNVAAFKILWRHHDEAVFGARRYRRKHLNKKLLDSGFKIEFSSYRLPFLFIIILIKKFFEWILKPKSNSKSDLQKLPSWINKFFLFVCRIENYFLKKGFKLWFGSSLFIVAKKKSKIL